MGSTTVRYTNLSDLAVQCQGDGQGMMSQEMSSPTLVEDRDEIIKCDHDSLEAKYSAEDDSVYEERFRVDRRKLEQMLQGSENGVRTEAEDFFLEVMDSTNTHITWPSKLKIGAKSKKDPHIKVAGEPEDVKKAKDKIMAVLDTKSNRVTLKMDVSHTEHSHVIGKGGGNIKKVMQETGCHIHFPDSNRNNQTDKSNQVSIAGQPYGVECARQQIRDLLPIAFTFEAPIAGLLQMQMDPNSPVLARVQQQYNVTVAFKQRPRAYTATVVVRGTVNSAKSVKEATILLMEHFTGNMGTILPISLQLEVAAQHHLFMIGRGGSNLQQIMARTGASICFPDPNSMVSLSPKKGTIFINGPIDNVLAAREQIIGCLPLVLMFDMKEDNDCDQGSLNALMEKLDVFISVKPKPKQPSKSVIVKSIEENVTNMYEARRLLLGLDKEPMPEKAQPISAQLTSLPNYHGLLNHNLLNVATQKQPLLVMNRQLSPLTSPRADNSWLAHHGVMSPTMMVIPTSTHMSGPQNIYDVKKNGQCTIVKDLNQNTSVTYSTNLSPSQDTRTHSIGSTPGSPHHTQSSCNGDAKQPTVTLQDLVNRQVSNTASQQVDLEMLTKTLKQDLNLNSSGAHLMESLGNKMKLHNSGSGADLLAIHQLQQSSRSPNNSRRSFSLSMSLNSSRGSVTEAMMNARGSVNDVRSINGDSMLDKKAPGIERLADRFRTNDRLMASAGEHLMTPHNDRLSSQNDRLLTSSSGMKPPPGISQPPNMAVTPANVSAALADYERKKVMASKAIEQEPSGGTPRNPTDYWAGLGFSRSVPDSVMRERLKQNNVRYEGPNMETTYESHETEEDGDPWKSKQTGSPATAPSNPLPDHLVNKIEQYGLSTSLSSSVQSSDGVAPHKMAPPAPTNSWTENKSLAQDSNSDMAELFRKLGLDRYIDLFQQQEIDLATFTTLNDQDLKELGISTFGARRKMLLAIADLQKSRQKYFSPTPGSNNPFRQTSAGPFPQRHDIISQSGRW